MSPVISATVLNELYLTALCVWREMRGASDDERLACYWVISNRATDPGHRWPKTQSGVVVQKSQFSSFNSTDPNATKWPNPDLRPDWQAWLDIVAMLGDPRPDPTNGANAYENLPDEATKPPWAEQAKLVKVIGHTRFYRL